MTQSHRDDPEAGGRPLRALIDEICDDLGPRPSGGPEEYDAAILLRDKLRGWGIEATVERFRVGPRVLQTSIAACTLGYAVAYVLYFVWPVLALAILSAVFVAMLAPRFLRAGRVGITAEVNTSLPTRSKRTN